MSNMNVVPFIDQLLDYLRIAKNFKLLLGAFTALFCVSLSFSKSKNKSIYFRNGENKKMKELRRNTRFKRFSNGQSISDQGFQLAKEEPYVVWNDSVREVVISTPEHMKDFYSNDSKEHAKPPDYNMGYYFKRVLGHSVGAQNGAKWKQTRSQFDPHFSFRAAARHKQLFAKEIQNWLISLPNEPMGINGKGKSFYMDAMNACRVLPFKLIALTCYGDVLTEELFEELCELNAVHEELIKTTFFGRATRSRWYCMLPTREKRRIDQFTLDWEKFNMKIIDVSQKTGTYCPANEIFDGVRSGGKMTKEEFLQTIDEILFTNIDVTSVVFSFLLINLAVNLDVQDALREEIITAVPEVASDDGLDTYLGRTDSLLEYTCLESVRLNPAAWFSFAEYSPNDKKISGFDVPAGTPFIVDWKRLNTQSAIWNPPSVHPSVRSLTGQDFAPSRFRTMSPAQYRYSFFRYGLGARKCVGKNIAPVMMKLFLFFVLRRFRLEQVEDGQELKYRDDRFTVTPQQQVQFTEV